MNILIVGGAGYVGGQVAEVLSCDEHDITIFDNLTYESRYLKNSCLSDSTKPIGFIYGDIRDTKLLLSVLPQYDVVIWLAAIVGDGACNINHNCSWNINKDCVEWFVNNFNGKIIFMSTCSVYGDDDNLLLEDSKLHPLSVYAETKLLAEQYIVQNSKDYLIFRLGTLFGMGDAYSRLRMDLVVNLLVLKAFQRKNLTVHGGEQWRPLLHVKDVAHAISFSLSNGVTGLYNLSYRNFKIKEIAQEIDKLVGANIVYTEAPFEDRRNYRVSVDKMDQTGWTPAFDLKFGINEMYSIFKEGRIKDPDDILYSNVKFLEKNYGL